MRYTSIFSAVILFNILAYTLIKLRASIYKNDVFKPMIWNMKLSVTPIIILFIGTLSTLALLIVGSYKLSSLIRGAALISFVLTIICWLLFLPNSAYLITELNLTHREMDKYEVPIWYDIISVLTLSLSGVFNTILGISTIQVFYLIYFDPVTISLKNEVFMNLSAFIIIILVTIGIYLGREIRFNTWDLLHPLDFMKKLINHFNTEGMIKNFILFILLHSIFLLLMYYSFAPNFSA